MRDVVLSEFDVLRVGREALHRQLRRVHEGRENFGSPDADAHDHALGLCGELAVVRVYVPDRESEWWANAHMDIDRDDDVFGYCVRTRDRHEWDGWINGRDNDADRYHMLVTASGVKSSLLDVNVSPITMRVHGHVLGRDVMVPYYWYEGGAPGSFPNRPCWVIPSRCYESPS